MVNYVRSARLTGAFKDKIPLHNGDIRREDVTYFTMLPTTLVELACTYYAEFHKPMHVYWHPNPDKVGPWRRIPFFYSLVDHKGMMYMTIEIIRFGTQDYFVSTSNT